MKLTTTNTLKEFHDGGFTLIEIIVTLVLLGILAAAAGFGIVEVARGYASARENERMAQNARIALLRISREVMELESVTSATDKEIVLTNPDGEEVAIRLSGTDGVIVIDDGTEPHKDEILIDRVASFQLGYEDFDKNPWTTAMAVNQLAGIDVEFSLSRTDGMDPITFSTYINPRNNGTENLLHGGGGGGPGRGGGGPGGGGGGRGGGGGGGGGGGRGGGGGGGGGA